MAADKKPTPKQALDAAVFQVEEGQVREEEAALVGTWAFLCPINDGSCGKTVVVDEKAGKTEVTPFFSPGWPTKAIARERLVEHIADQKGEKPMSSLQEFREKHGLQQADDGLRAVFTAKDF